MTQRLKNNLTSRSISGFFNPKNPGSKVGWKNTCFSFLKQSGDNSDDFLEQDRTVTGANYTEWLTKLRKRKCEKAIRTKLAKSTLLAK